MKKPIDFKGMRFGRFVVQDYLGRLPYGESGIKARTWECVCDCGTTFALPSFCVKKQSSCGCYKKEKLITNNKSRTKPIIDRVVKSIFYSYKIGAKRRKIPFNLTQKDITSFIFSPCVYCGQSPMNICKKSVSGSMLYNGIDRVNNTLGYYVSNCVSCCTICNRAKQMMSLKEFTDWVEKVYLKLFIK